MYSNHAAPRVDPSGNTSDIVRFSHANNLAALLESQRISILVSTYQADRVFVVDGRDGQLHLEFHSFHQPMGMALDAERGRLFVADRYRVWQLDDHPSIGNQLPQPANHCFLTKSSQETGDIKTHQIALAEDGLWIVNTRFSCLCTLDDQHSFVPRWRPEFIDQWVPEDRCHLNGLAMDAVQPKYVTLLGCSNIAEGWRQNKATSGCLIDVETEDVILDGLSMPHSPELHEDTLYFLNSGHGELVRVEDSKTAQPLARFPGFTRGLAFHQNLAFIGLSKIRETATFGGLPVAEKPRDLKCGFAVFNLRTGKLESQFEFKNGVEEIFDIIVVPRSTGTTLRGPRLDQDDVNDLWVLPNAVRNT